MLRPDNKMIFMDYEIKILEIKQQIELLNKKLEKLNYEYDSYKSQAKIEWLLNKKD